MTFSVVALLGSAGRPDSAAVGGESDDSKQYDGPQVADQRFLAAISLQLPHCDTPLLSTICQSSSPLLLLGDRGAMFEDGA